MEGLLIGLVCFLLAIVAGLCGYIWRQHAKRDAGILADLKEALVQLNSTMELIRVEFTTDIQELDTRVTVVEVRCNERQKLK